MRLEGHKLCGDSIIRRCNHLMIWCYRVLLNIRSEIKIATGSMRTLKAGLERDIDLIWIGNIISFKFSYKGNLSGFNCIFKDMLRANLNSISEHIFISI